MKNLTEGNIYKNFILFALPSVLSGVISQAFGLLDTAIAGNFLGQNGLASIGATSQLISFFSCAFWGFNTGFGMYIARLFGAGDYKNLKNHIYNALIIEAATIMFFGILMIIFSKPILTALNIEKDLMGGATIYFIIYMAGAFSMLLMHTFITIMNALGSSGTPLFISFFVTILNISLKVFFITVLKLGVAGIAISTVIATLVGNIIYFIKLNGCFKVMKVKDLPFYFDFAAIKNSCKYTASCAFQQASMYIATFALAPIINGLGAAAIAGYMVAMRLYDTCAGIYQNAAKTLGNYEAQCVGMGQYKKIRKGLFVGLIQNLIILVPLIVLFALLASPICSMFFPKGYTGQSLKIAILFAQIYLPFILFNMINNLFHNFFRGVAAIKFLLISTILGSVLRLGSCLIFSQFYKMEGIFMGFVISWIGEAVFMIIVYFLKFRDSEKISLFVHSHN